MKKAELIIGGNFDTHFWINPILNAFNNYFPEVAACLRFTFFNKEAYEEEFKFEGMLPDDLIDEFTKMEADLLAAHPKTSGYYYVETYLDNVRLHPEYNKDGDEMLKAMLTIHGFAETIEDVDECRSRWYDEYNEFSVTMETMLKNDYDFNSQEFEVVFAGKIPKSLVERFMKLSHHAEGLFEELNMSYCSVVPDVDGIDADDFIEE